MAKYFFCKGYKNLTRTWEQGASGLSELRASAHNTCHGLCPRAGRHFLCRDGQCVNCREEETKRPAQRWLPHRQLLPPGCGGQWLHQPSKCPWDLFCLQSRPDQASDLREPPPGTPCTLSDLYSTWSLLLFSGSE